MSGDFPFGWEILVFGGLFPLVGLVFVCFVFTLFLRARRQRRVDGPSQILRERFARGEISEEVFRSQQGILNR